MVLGLITVFMAYKATQVKLDYNLPRLLPESDTVNQEYEKFIHVFGSHGNVIVLGIQDENIYKLANFNALFEMGNAIKEIPGVEGLISIAHVYNLTKNDLLKKFEFKPIVISKPQTQAELDSIMGIINSLPFYEGVIYNKNTGALLIPVTLNKDIINTEKC